MDFREKSHVLQSNGLNLQLAALVAHARHWLHQSDQAWCFKAVTSHAPRLCRPPVCLHTCLIVCLSAPGNKNPGPSEYSPRQKLVRSTSPCFTFKGVSAKDHRVRNPAPGQYNPDRCVETESCHATAPAISLSQRLSPPKSHSRQPAPGEYDNYKPYLAMNKGLPVSLKFR